MTQQCHSSRRSPAVQSRPITSPNSQPLLDQVFVYGTLMSGESRHRQLCPFIEKISSPATISGRLYDLGDYPALVRGQELKDENVVLSTPPSSSIIQSDLVVGELIQIKNVELALVRLDAIEGYHFANEQSLYVRRKVLVTGPLEGGDKIVAWTYFYNHTIERQIPRIVSGDWRKRHA